jgi:hypothetical protein
MSQPSFRDVELLNAYLDGELDANQRQRLESRLGSDLELKSILEELREARFVLRRLPQRRAPRNFTLTPKMAGIKPPLPRSYPVFRFASAFAAILLFFSYALNILPRVPLSFGAAAPAPAMEIQTGIGGGGEPEETQRDQSGGGCDSCTAEATQMAEAPFAPSEKQPPEPQATLTPEAEMQKQQQDQTNAVPTNIEESQPFRLTLSPLQITLLAVTLFAGLAALLIRLRTERAFDRKNKAG